jgi:hypothetical protein
MRVCLLRRFDAPRQTVLAPDPKRPGGVARRPFTVGYQAAILPERAPPDTRGEGGCRAGRVCAPR